MQFGNVTCKWNAVIWSVFHMKLQTNISKLICQTILSNTCRAHGHSSFNKNEAYSISLFYCQSVRVNHQRSERTASTASINCDKCSLWQIYIIHSMYTLELEKLMYYYMHDERLNEQTIVIISMQVQLHECFSIKNSLSQCLFTYA